MAATDENAVRAKLAAKRMSPPSTAMFPILPNMTDVGGPRAGEATLGPRQAAGGAPAARSAGAAAGPSNPFEAMGITDWGAPFQQHNFKTPQGSPPAAQAGTMGPPTADDEMTARRKLIASRDVGRVAQMQRLNQMGPNVLAENGGQAAARAALADLAAQRFASTQEYGAIGRAQAPVQKVQDPTQVATARADISAQLGRTLLQQRLAAAKAGGQPIDYDVTVSGAQADAGKALPQYSGTSDPRIAQIIQGQQSLAAKQQDHRRGALTEEATRQGNVNFAGEQERVKQAVYARDIEAKKRELGLAGGDVALAGAGTELARLGAEKVQYGVQADPGLARRQIETKLTQAEIEGQKAKSALAATTAVAGGEQALAPLADPRLDTHVQSFKNAIAQGVGVGDPEANRKIEQATAGIRAYIEGLPPDQAAAIKAQLRASLPLSSVPSLGEIGGTALAGLTPAGPFRITAQYRQKRAIADLRNFLSQ